MMFSKSCEYAIKAVIHLCITTGNGSRLNISEIAEAIDSPEPFTAKILQSLSRNGIISSSKGPGGGFYIDHRQKPLHVIDIVYVMDGREAFERCGLGLKKCSEEHPCPIHHEFRGYSRKLKQLLENKTVQDLATDIIMGKAFLTN